MLTLPLAAISRGEAQLAVSSYELGISKVVELVGIEPTAGQHVKARPASPWIAPQKTKASSPQFPRLGLLAFTFIDILNLYQFWCRKQEKKLDSSISFLW